MSWSDDDSQLPPEKKGPQHQVIRASAGSGKTFALTTRYLQLMSQGVGPQAILATTFTRKAAGEILDRVLFRLAGAAASEQSARALAEHLESETVTLATCRQMLAQLCQSLHLVWIATIDSFFNRMALTFRHELGLPRGAAIIGDDDPLAVELRNQAVDQILDDRDLPLLISLLKQLHHDRAQRSVSEALGSLVAQLYDVYRLAPDEATWTQLQHGTPLTDDQLQRVFDACEHAAEQAPTDSLRKAAFAMLDAAQRSDWKACFTKGVGKAVRTQGTDATYYKKPIPEELIACAQHLIAHGGNVLLGRIARQTHATWQLLRRFDHHYTALRRQHRVLLFSDLPLMLSRDLALRSEVFLNDFYYRLDRRVAHLMLDEFQDTSPQQWQVIEPLAREITAWGDRSRSLFCVGDVKQAIYGWRGGCAAIFDRLERSLQLGPDVRGTLDTSYRSSQVVLDAVDQVFGQIADLPALEPFEQTTSAWCRGYRPHHAARDLPGYVALEASEPPAEDDLSDASDDAEDDAEEGEAKPARVVHLRWAADRIVQLVREAPGASVGVLVSTNKAAQRLLFELHQRGLTHVSGEGGAPVTDEPAVQVVLSAMLLADHPGHSAAAFHVAHSPLGPIVGLSSYHPETAVLVSQRLRRNLASRGFAKVISDWVEQLAPACDVRALLRLAQLVELADKHDQRPTLRPGDFVELVRSTPVEEPAPAPVRVMTVHKAKGLEFDLVILPELDRRLLQMADRPVYVDRDDSVPAGPVRAVFRSADDLTRSLSPQLELAFLQEQDRRLTDDLCALYVAMTRPRHALHLLVQPTTFKDNGSPCARPFGYAKILREAMLADPDMTGTLLYEAGDRYWHKTKFKSSAAAEPVPALPTRADAAPVLRFNVARGSSRRHLPQVSASGLAGAGRVNVADLLAGQPAQAQVRGTLLHAFYEQISWIDQDGPLPDEQLLAIARRIAPIADPAWIEQQIQQFRATTEHPVVQQALAHPPLGDADELALWRERTFAISESGQLLQGQFDRVVIWLQRGRAVRAQLLDFKTDRMPDAGPQSLIAHYQPQIHAYERALRVLLHLPPDAIESSLLFVGAGLHCGLE